MHLHVRIHRWLSAVRAVRMVAAAAAPVLAEDWKQFGGRDRLGIWHETGIVEALPEKLKVTWRTPIGAGYSGPAVADGRVVDARAGRQAIGRTRQPGLVGIDGVVGLQFLFDPAQPQFRRHLPQRHQADPVLRHRGDLLHPRHRGPHAFDGLGDQPLDLARGHVRVRGVDDQAREAHVGKEVDGQA